MDKLLYLAGCILKPKGLKGELKVLPETDFPESFLQRKLLFVGATERSAVERRVAGATLQNGFVLLRFYGIDSREDAESIVGERIYITEDDLIPLPPDTAYIHDLVGLRVLDEDCREIGVIRDVLKLPAHEVYEIAAGDKIVLVPAIEEFVVETDLEKGEMTIRRFDEFL